MSPHSLIRYLTLSALCHVVLSVPQAPLAVGQASPTFVSGAAPANAEPTGASQGCGSCLLVADVAGLVWYSQVFLNNAATELVGVGVNNGTRATRTSVIQNEGEFTYNPASASGGGALTQVNFEPSITISGAVLYESPNSFSCK